MPARKELPSTLRRSSQKAQRTWSKAHDSAVETYGGVDVEGHTREELYQRARRLGIKGRSRMTKYELADAIARKQRS